MDPTQDLYTHNKDNNNILYVINFTKFVIPVQKENPSSNPILVLAFFPLSSGEAYKARRKPIAAKDVKKFPDKTLVNK